MNIKIFKFLIKPKMPHCSWFTKVLCCALLITLSACEQPNQLENTLKDVSTNSELEGRLVLQNSTLEQSDNEGNKLWKLQAKRAIYNDNQEIATLEDLKGHLFRDGEIVLQVTGKKGEILEEGQKIFLRENIVATDPRNGAVIRGDEIEWIPAEDTLVIKNKITGEHPQIRTSAQEGRYLTDKQRLELKGEVTATTKEPPLQLKTEQLLWEIEQKKVNGTEKIQIDRYEKNTITDRVVAERWDVNLATKIATLTNNVELKSLAPRLQIATNSAIWNAQLRTVSSDKPVQIVHNEEKITLTANAGFVDLKEEVVRLQGGVKGLSLSNQGNLYADKLTWEVPTQIVRAKGNVIYRQVDPPFNLKGVEAVGRLQDESIVVNGGGTGGRVVTEIIPE